MICLFAHSNAEMAIYKLVQDSTRFVMTKIQYQAMDAVLVARLNLSTNVQMSLDRNQFVSCCVETPLRIVLEENRVMMATMLTLMDAQVDALSSLDGNAWELSWIKARVMS